MNENELLQQLRRLASEQAGSEPPLLDERWDERWDRLAAGTLSAEEEAELRRLAEGSEEARMAYEAFRPLGAAFHARVMETIARSNEPPFRRTVRWLAAWGIAARAAVATLLPSPPVVRRLAVSGAAAAVMAATPAMLLWRAPAMPGYALAVSGGAFVKRGEAAETPTWAPGDRFQASLSPDTAVKGAWPLHTRAFLLRGAEVRWVQADAEPEPSGAVRVTGTLDRDLPPGTWTLWVVVGRWGTLPSPAELRTLSAAHPQNQKHWVAMPEMLNVRPREPG